MNATDTEMRDAFISELYLKAQSDSSILFLSCEYGAPSLDQFRRDLSGQFVNMGISEQNLISVAAGLALEGKRVFVYSIASFITLRCLEQIKLDLCVMELPVTILGVGPCYAYGMDGPTHHATEDLALMRPLAGMSIYSPSDAQMAAQLVPVALQAEGPVYCRLDKGKYPNLPHCTALHWQQGFRTLGGGEKLAIVATGTMVHRGIEIQSALAAQGIDIAVVDLFRPKPIACEQLGDTLRGFDRILTLEEHTVNGGIGSMVAEMLAECGPRVPFKRMAVEDAQLYAYGSRDRLHRQRGLDADSMVRQVLRWYDQKEQ